MYEIWIHKSSISDYPLQTLNAKKTLTKITAHYLMYFFHLVKCLLVEINKVACVELILLLDIFKNNKTPIIYFKITTQVNVSICCANS